MGGVEGKVETAHGMPDEDVRHGRGDCIFAGCARTVFAGAVCVGCGGLVDALLDDALAQSDGGIQFAEVFCEATHVGPRVSFAVGTPEVMEINGEEGKTCGVCFLGQFLLEEVVVIAVEVENDAAGKFILRIYPRGTAEGIFNEGGVEVAILKGMNAVRSAEQRVFCVRENSGRRRCSGNLLLGCCRSVFAF